MLLLAGVFLVVLLSTRQIVLQKIYIYLLCYMYNITTQHNITTTSDTVYIVQPVVLA